MLHLHRAKSRPCNAWRSWTRCLATQSSPEHLKLTRTGGHEFSLDIYHSKTRQQDAVVLFFPRGPLLPDEEADHHSIAVLRATLDCPIVQVNYTFDHLHQHPSPVYDAVSAYDWSVENLLPARSTTFRGASRMGRFGVCGELVGGTLATVLALTECRAGQPGVVAAAVKDPIADWFDLEGAHTTKKRSRRKAQADVAVEPTQPNLEQLTELRQKLFRRPRDWVDPFASPIMLFRSAGAAIPASLETDLEGDLYYDEALHGENAAATDVAAAAERVESATRYSRQFPARALGLQLPRFRVISGESPFLKSQAEELVQQLRASVVRQRKARTGLRNRWRNTTFHDHDEQDLIDEDEESKDLALAMDRIEHQVNDLAKADIDTFQENASWLKQQLQK